MTTASTALLTNGVWRVDPARSYVGFEVRHLRVAKVQGRFRRFSARVRDTGDGLRIDGRVDTASVETGDATRDERLRTGFFHCDRFPSIEFGARCGAPVRDDAWFVAGTLTIRDAIRPVVLQATTEPLDDEAIRVLVNGEISRSEYGLEWEALRQAGRLLVSDRVTLVVGVVLTRDLGVGAGG